MRSAAACRIGRQLGRLPQEGGGRGEASTCLRPPGRLLELDGDVLIGAACGMGTMPGAAIRFARRIGHVRQRTVHALPLPIGCRPVDRRAHQRMAKTHGRTDLQQPGTFPRLQYLGRNLEPSRRAPHQRRITDGVSRGNQQQQSRPSRQRLEPPQEALLDPTRQRQHIRQAEPARQLRRRESSGQLQQRKWIATRLRDDPVADPLIEPARDHCRQQCTRIILVEPVERQLRQADQLAIIARLANREHDRHRLRQQPSRDESEDLARRAVQPLSVIHEA